MVCFTVVEKHYISLSLLHTHYISPSLSMQEILAQCEDDPELIDSVMESMDTDGDGRVSFEDFCSGLKTVRKMLTKPPPKAHSTPEGKDENSKRVRKRRERERREEREREREREKRREERERERDKFKLWCLYHF